jgi:hypothetical protein
VQRTFIALAAKVTVGKPGADAVSVLRPGLGPSVQPPTAATPDAFDVAVPPLMDPPPLATANVTTIPDFGFPFASLTVTAGATATGLPAVPF